MSQRAADSSLSGTFLCVARRRHRWSCSCEDSSHSRRSLGSSSRPRIVRHRQCDHGQDRSEFYAGGHRSRCVNISPFNSLCVAHCHSAGCVESPRWTLTRETFVRESLTRLIINGDQGSLIASPPTRRVALCGFVSPEARQGFGFSALRGD